MIRFGTITETDPDKYLARVKFETEDIMSDWLPMITRGAKETKSEFPLDSGEIVACLMDNRAEDGVILGAIYTESVAPDAKSKDIFQVKFGDGLTAAYSRADKKLDLKLDNCEVIMTATGFTIKKSTDSLKKILDDLIDQIKLITVTTPNGPSGTPINAVAFDPIKTSVDNLFEN